LAGRGRLRWRRPPDISSGTFSLIYERAPGTWRFSIRVRQPPIREKDDNGARRHWILRSTTDRARLGAREELPTSGAVKEPAGGALFEQASCVHHAQPAVQIEAARKPRAQQLSAASRGSVLTLTTTAAPRAKWSA
jgi:hypothetical protein